MRKSYKINFLIIAFILFGNLCFGANSNEIIKSDNQIASKTIEISDNLKKGDNYKELKTNLKTNVRNIFENVNRNFKANEFGVLPKGISIIEGEGFRGIKIIQSYMEFKVHTWLDDTGILENYNRCKKEDENLIAAVNGGFFSERGVLGQVVQDGKIPKVKQIPGKLSRCFVCGFRNRKNVQYWYLGETPLTASQILHNPIKEFIWFNGSADSSVACDNLLGGGGWILKNRKDVHWDAVERQFFRFRQEDQTSRKTVVAQDINRNLYFIVFEAGFTLHKVALTFVKNDIFKDVQDVIFFDGGSSSCIVLNGKYLVAPLYLVDKCRFSCIQIREPDIIW